jgi:hypothetical protein
MLIVVEGARLLREQRESDKGVHFVLGETPQVLWHRGGRFFLWKKPSPPAPRKASAFNGNQHHCLTEIQVPLIT